MRYFMHLRYFGKHYHGWQRQINTPSVQGEIEKAISTLLQESIKCHGCGRTDKGVHASQYVLHFDASQQIETNLVARLNKFLPDDITIYEIAPVPSQANAQLDAIARTYQYHLHFTPSPFLVDVSTYLDKGPPDLGMLREVQSLFIGAHDFRAYCLQPDHASSTHCEIISVGLNFEDRTRRLCLQFEGNRFLRGMIRFLVQSSLEVAWGQRDIDEVRSALLSGTPLTHRKQAFPQGLHLTRVCYSYLDFTPITLRLGFDPHQI